mmetsp:Transcript_26497/g.50844  ORF Transcript_26497/g.50844 Transcript_26497/m.50844 type:complete len:116 (-) Transcript_26497:256-603(-)
MLLKMQLDSCQILNEGCISLHLLPPVVNLVVSLMSLAEIVLWKLHGGSCPYCLYLERIECCQRVLAPAAAIHKSGLSRMMNSPPNFDLPKLIHIPQLQTSHLSGVASLQQVSHGA